MVKVKITRDCSIKGKHYKAGDIAEVIEKDAHIVKGIEKAVDYVGHYAPPEKKRAKSRWIWSLTSERCSTILVCLQH